MTASTEELAGLRTLGVRVGAQPGLVVAMLHGYQMRPEDLSPFASSLGVPAHFYLPAGPITLPDGNRAWWPIDEERRANTMARGPRDLATERPPGATAARYALHEWLAGIAGRHDGLPIVAVGFSQGGMLLSELALRERTILRALALLSSSRIFADEWHSLTLHDPDLPVLIAHGRADQDLGFHAGEALAEFYRTRTGSVTWVPFDGGHEIPLVVWRALRKFLSAVR